MSRTTLRPLLARRLQSVRLACSTLPDASSWWQCTLVYGAFLVLALPAGILLDFISFAPPVDSWPMVVILLVILFVAPSLLEELLFRAMLLPHPREGVSRPRVIGYALISLLAFVMWHPLNGLVFSPRVWPTYANPVFLVLATLFGGTVTIAYLISGSIWPSVVMHWLTVAGWILFFGGRGIVRGTLGI